MLVDLFRTADPVEGFGDTVRVRTILDRSTEYIDDDLQNQPEIRARLTNMLGRVYGNLGLHDEALELYQKAFDLQLELNGRAHPSVADGLYRLAETQRSRRNFEAAESLYVETLELRRSLNDNLVNVANTLQGLAVTLRELGQVDSALVLTGGVVFYQSKIIMNDVRIVNAQGEDALNLVHSDFSLLDLEICDTRSDGLDIDFSDGDIIDILLTDKYSAQTPQVDANVADTIQDVDTSYSGISFNSGAVIVRLISDGSNTLRF